jgi:hypothetical protein
VTVVAAASQVESIALSDRLSWMREEHAGEPNVVFVGMLDDAPIDYQSARAWAAHNAIFDAALRRVGGGPVDAVFSGEDYGDELARHHGAVHVRVGQERLASGTGCRADVAASWDLLAPATRAGLAGRLAVLGAESTGTTAVSRALAEHFRARGGVWTRTQWVAEYGRERSEEKLAELRAADSSADLDR